MMDSRETPPFKQMQVNCAKAGFVQGIPGKRQTKPVGLAKQMNLRAPHGSDSPGRTTGIIGEILQTDRVNLPNDNGL